MKEIFRLCLVLTIIAAVSAGVLAFVSQKTAEPIKNALREEKMSAVRSVLPPFDNEPDTDTRTVGQGEEAVVFYRGRKDGAIVGAAFPVVAPNGYSGEIEIMVGVDTAGVVQGIAILQHRETPGLGAKIESEEFRSNYTGKSLADPEVWDVMKDGGTFKQITGATISSRAVTHAVARGLELFAAHRGEILDPAEAAPPSAPNRRIDSNKSGETEAADSSSIDDSGDDAGAGGE
jgi:electron transport complex protein RnfG